MLPADPLGHDEVKPGLAFRTWNRAQEVEDGNQLGLDQLREDHEQALGEKKVRITNRLRKYKK